MCQVRGLVYKCKHVHLAALSRCRGHFPRLNLLTGQQMLRCREVVSCYLKAHGLCGGCNQVKRWKARNEALDRAKREFNRLCELSLTTNLSYEDLRLEEAEIKYRRAMVRRATEKKEGPKLFPVPRMNRVSRSARMWQARQQRGSLLKHVVHVDELENTEDLTRR